MIIINIEVVLREFSKQINLTKTLAFHIYELKKVIIFNEYKDLILTSFQVLNLKKLNNIKEPLIITFITNLYKNHLL